MWNLIVFAMLFLPLIANSQPSDDPAIILRRAIETPSETLMKKFFESWYRASNVIRRKPHTKLQRTAEAIVKTVWLSKEFREMAWGWERDSNTFHRPHFIVMPSKVMIRYGDNMALAQTDSLAWMAPATMHNTRILFDLPRFKDSLNQYMFPEVEDSRANTRFISKFLSLGCRMMGCHALSYPVIDPIDVNSGYNFATVGCGGGIHATLIRTGRTWKVVKVEGAGIIE